MPGQFTTLESRHFREMMDINYFGAVHTSRAFLPPLIQRKQPGHLCNVGSLLSVMGIFGYSAYAASKFALYGFSEVLRAELWPHNIHVSILLPPDTDTPQHSFELQYLPAETKAIAGNVKMLSADSVATTLLKGMAAQKFEIIPGLESQGTVLAQRLMPGVVRWLLRAPGTTLGPAEQAAWEAARREGWQPRLLAPGFGAYDEAMPADPAAGIPRGRARRARRRPACESAARGPAGPPSPVEHRPGGSRRRSR